LGWNKGFDIVVIRLIGKG